MDFGFKYLFYWVLMFRIYPYALALAIIVRMLVSLHGQLVVWCVGRQMLPN